MKFLIDMPLTPALVAWLAARSHDAVHASAIGLAHASDTEILAHALLDGRMVVTADLDFPRLLALTAAGGPAVVLFRGGALSDTEMLHLMERVLATVSVADMERSITVVERTRVRRTPLPLRPPPPEER